MRMGGLWNWLGATFNVGFRCCHRRNVGFFCESVDAIDSAPGTSRANAVMMPRAFNMRVA